MARFSSILVLGVAGWTAITPASAWSQEPRPAAPSPSQKDPRLPEGDELLAVLLGRAIPNLDTAELAGMVAGTKLPLLSMRQAYSLTLIRARKPDATLAVVPAGIFDAKAVEEQANRSDALDFDRFRREFLSSEFRDPAPGFFAALRHRQEVDSARHQVALAENMLRLYEKLIQSETSGLSRLQVDMVDSYLQISRQALGIDLSGYRSTVDELKVSLGLAPGTSLVLDDRILQPFTTVFTAVDAWQRNPQRQLEELTPMHDRLPRLEDHKIGGRSLLEVVRETLAEEPFLVSCVEFARSHQPILKDDRAKLDDRNDLELRIRRLVRGLIMIHKNYELERRRMELALREVDQWFEQIVAPPAGGARALAQSANAASYTTGVIGSQTRLYRGRDQIVSLWLQFKEQSLALDRELGTMPYDNWEAFHRSFLPVAGRQEPEVGRPQ
jgi:hypothetical protein